MNKSTQAVHPPTRSESMSAAMALRAPAPASGRSRAQARGIRCSNELYREHEPLLKKLSRKFQRKYGGYLPDLQSEAEEYFLIACKDYDGERDFKTWVRFVVWHTLLAQAKKRAIRNATFRRVCADLAFIRAKPCFHVSQLLQEVSEDAATLIELALTPKRDGREESPKRRRENIVNFLLEQGWKPWRVLDAIDEVREALS